MRMATFPPGILPMVALLLLFQTVTARIFESASLANDDLFANHHDEKLEARDPEEPTDGYGLPPPYGPITSESSAKTVCK